MGYECKIIEDSLAPNGKRLTTFQITLPRCMLAELNTHRQFSRNSASSRAIPVEKMVERVMIDPFIPAKFPMNQKGMQAQENLSEHQAECAHAVWLVARNKAVEMAKELLCHNVHKQITNRLLEPFLWHTVIVTATEWSNFWAQRCDKDAQPEIQKIAYMMQDLYFSNEPEKCEEGDWHTPYIFSDERSSLDIETQKRVSVARCARVSYLTQDGRREIDKDLELFQRLTTGSHWSPFEHVATPAASSAVRSGNFVGWLQFRKEFPNECR